MNLGYLLREGLAGLRRTPLAAITSMFSLFLAVLLIGVLARVGYNVYEVAGYLKSRVEVEVFLEDLDRQSERELEQRILSEALVEGVRYVSREDASGIFRQEFGMSNEAEALAELNFLPASLKVEPTREASVAQVDSLVGVMGELPGVADIRFNLALLETLERRSEQLTLAGGIIVFFVLLTAMILVFNTIRLTIYAKRDLIRAMKLVGATNRFIRGPFVMEGMMQGAIAGSLALGVVVAGFEGLLPRLITRTDLLGWPYGEWYYLVGALFFLAIWMGWAGSFWAARRFIRNERV